MAHEMRAFFERRVGAKLARTILTGETASNLEAGRVFYATVWGVDDEGVKVNVSSTEISPSGQPYNRGTGSSRLNYGDWLLGWVELGGLESFWVAILDRVDPDYVPHLKAQTAN